jgi:hypothetical protein
LPFECNLQRYNTGDEKKAAKAAKFDVKPMVALCTLNQVDP